MDSNAAAKFRKAHPVFGFLADSEIQGVDSSPNIGGLVKSFMAKNPEGASQLGEALLKTLANALPKIPTARDLMANDENAAQGMRPGTMLKHNGRPVTVLHADTDAQIVTVRLPSGHVARVPSAEFTSTAFSQEMTPKAHSGGALRKSAKQFTAGQRIVWKTNDNAPLSYGVILEPGALDSMVEFTNNWGTSKALVPNKQLTAA
jgi:hypothetical protein